MRRNLETMEECILIKGVSGLAVRVDPSLVWTVPLKQAHISCLLGINRQQQPSNPPPACPSAPALANPNAVGCEIQHRPRASQPQPLLSPSLSPSLSLSLGDSVGPGPALTGVSTTAIAICCARRGQ